MPKFIALDASTESCSVTLANDGLRYTLSSHTPKTHAHQLLPFVNELLLRASICLGDLDFIACCQGPGSFTGLRIGLGIAQGLAYGAGIPLVEVGSLAAMARQVGKENEQPVDRIVTMLDARMGEIYWAVHSGAAEVPQVVRAPTLTTPDLLRDAIAQIIHQGFHSVVLAGDAVRLLSIPQADLGGAALAEHVAPTSDAMADIAEALWRDGVGTPPDEFRLDYLRNSVSWNKRQRIRSQ